MANLGRITRVEPIRLPQHVSSIKRLLTDSPRNLAIFTIGINTALRASDLLRIRLSDVKHLSPGEHFVIREKKTGKARQVTLNRASHNALQKYLGTRRSTRDDAPLFLSRKGGHDAITVRHLNRMVQAWAKECSIKGRFGSHSLRKTFGYMQRTQFKTDLPTLMVAFNHSSQLQTLTYLGVQADDVHRAFMNEI
ncbi:MAG: tyrosine-type recombinase/integrase [Oligoflexales bacterium]|nr:tyrosine-type recombinase/integrase [Oligoflexales bacterium]